MVKVIWNFIQLFSVYISLISFNAHAQLVEEQLQLSDLRRKKENLIEIKVSAGLYNDIKESRNQKVYWKDSWVKVNGSKTKLKNAHTRGSTSHNFRRKSFSFSFGDSVQVYDSKQKYQFKHIYALNLVWDKYYFYNRFAFSLMQDIGLCHLFNSYTEIKINGKNEGIYLLMERPQDWAINSAGSPFIVRKGYDHEIDKNRIAKGVDSLEAAAYSINFEKLYSELENKRGEILYNHLSGIMNVEMYMKWMAFNYLLDNGDYTDELYFYIDPTTNKFSFIPWDYDDIFSPEPHEGLAVRDSILGDRLIFSSEDVLDVKIANDPYLYSKYLVELENLLHELQPELIKEKLELVYAELHPYYSNKSILSMNRFDWFNDASKYTLVEELNNTYRQLVESRNRILNIIK